MTGAASEVLLLAEGLRGELVHIPQTFPHELVPGHEAGLTILEEGEQLLGLLLKVVETDTFLSHATVSFLLVYKTSKLI